MRWHLAPSANLTILDYRTLLYDLQIFDMRLAMALEGLQSLQCTVADGLARVMLNAPERGNPIDGPSAAR